MTLIGRFLRKDDGYVRDLEMQVEGGAEKPLVQPKSPKAADAGGLVSDAN